MNTTEFLSILRERNVRLWVDNGRLKCDAPPGVLDDGLRAQLAARKEELLTLIAGAETALSAPRSLVPLKPTGDHPPLFARPGHNGDVFCYRALAAHLDPARPSTALSRRVLTAALRLRRSRKSRSTRSRRSVDSSPRGRTTLRATAPAAPSPSSRRGSSSMREGTWLGSSCSPVLFPPCTALAG